MLVVVVQALVGQVHFGRRRAGGGSVKAGRCGDALGERQQAGSAALPTLRIGIDGGVVGGEIIQVAAEHRELRAVFFLHLDQEVARVAHADFRVTVERAPAAQRAVVPSRGLVILIGRHEQGVPRIRPELLAALDGAEFALHVDDAKPGEIGVDAARLAKPEIDAVVRAPRVEHAAATVGGLPPKNRRELRGLVIVVAAGAPRLAETHGVFKTGIGEDLTGGPGEAGVIDDGEGIEFESEAVLVVPASRIRHARELLVVHPVRVQAVGRAPEREQTGLDRAFDQFPQCDL